MAAIRAVVPDAEIDFDGARSRSRPSSRSIGVRPRRRALPADDPGRRVSPPRSRTSGAAGLVADRLAAPPPEPSASLAAVSTTRVVDIAALPGAREADERASRIAARLPDELVPLARIAFDYRWSSEPDGAELFCSLDPLAWELNGRNPVRQLEDLPPHAVEAAAGDAATRDRIARLAQVLEDDRARPDRPVDGLDGPVVFVCAEFGSTPRCRSTRAGWARSRATS